MTWRLYPQFGDAVRADGRVTTVRGLLSTSLQPARRPGGADLPRRGDPRMRKLKLRHGARQIDFADRGATRLYLLALAGANHSPRAGAARDDRA